MSQGQVDLFAEPRGSRRLPAQPKFDLKLEKRFPLANGQLGVTVEGFNLFNDGAVNDKFARSGPIFDQPQGLVSPRQLRLGVVYRF
jgi:hypothetical protein